MTRKKRGRQPKHVDVDHKALLDAADEFLWGATNKGRIAEDNVPDALVWLRHIVDTYEGSVAAVKNDLDWNDAWRQRLLRLYDKSEGTRHITSTVVKLAEGLRRKVDTDATILRIRGSDDRAVKARLRWWISKYFRGMQTEVAERAGFHVSYINHVLNPNKDENLPDSFVMAMAQAGVSHRWLYTGEGEPMRKSLSDHADESAREADSTTEEVAPNEFPQPEIILNDSEAAVPSEIRLSPTPPAPAPATSQIVRRQLLIDESLWGACMDRGSGTGYIASLVEEHLSRLARNDSCARAVEDSVLARLEPKRTEYDVPVKEMLSLLADTMTKRELGRRLGVSQRTIWKWENTDTIPSEENATAIFEMYRKERVD